MREMRDKRTEKESGQLIVFRWQGKTAGGHNQKPPVIAVDHADTCSSDVTRTPRENWKLQPRVCEKEP